VDRPFGYAAARMRAGRVFVSTEVGADGRFGVVIYDLEDPQNPRLLGSVRVPNGAGLSRVRSAAQFDVSVDLIGDVMFATGEGSIYAVDLSKIVEPREIRAVSRTERRGLGGARCRSPGGRGPRRSRDRCHQTVSTEAAVPDRHARSGALGGDGA
jgi:hypothetical protein